MLEPMIKEMEQVLVVVAEDLATVRTGRAKPSLVEKIQVEAYPGTRLPLIELATITAPDPHLLVVQPWDQSILKAIETELAKSDLQLNPVVDGQVVRINIPPLTAERREDLVKLTKQKLESGREMMREARTKMKRIIDSQKGQPDVSEDDIERWLEEMQILHDKYMAKLDELGTKKEAELREF